MRSIEGIDGFPKDEEIGLNYLKCSLKNKCKDAGMYLCRFFISQSRVKDYTQADFYLSKCAADCEEELEKEEAT